ncbi:MAG: acyl-CoA dehydrogenase family protein [Dehalococcoidia bacterium]
MTTTASRTQAGAGPIDYASFESAIGLNWYLTDPNLRFIADRHIAASDRAWAEEYLVRWGALVGGEIAPRSEVVDRNPPRLERYDEWGNDVSRVVHHPDNIANKKAIWEKGPKSIHTAGKVVPTVLGSTFTYLLSQCDTGMVCATGMTGGVESLVERYAPPGVRERVLPHLAQPQFDGSWDGAMFMTEIRGGSDLARSETTARQESGTWLLSGSKWFCSNADARAIVTLARPEGAPDGLRGLALFLIPAERSDGSRNGIRIKRVKDKLGTRSVPTAEIDLEDAEAFLLGGTANTEGQPDTRGLNRMMSMVNGSRLGVSFMGLGIMRRSFLEASIYAAHREAFGQRLDSLPLMQETLVKMCVDVEATATMCFETSSLAGAHGDERARQLYRIMVPLSKFRGARGGLELASQAVEVMGGNGYIENWPAARQLRDAQCHTIWEGTENIICLDVLRAMRKEQAHHALFDRIDGALAAADHPALAATKDVVAQARRDVQGAVEFVTNSADDLRQLHSRRLTGWLSDVAQAALLLEHAAIELRENNSARKAAVAKLFVQERLASRAMRGISEDRSVLDLFAPVTRFESLEPALLN